MTARKDVERLRRKYRKFARLWCDEGTYSERHAKHGLKIKCAYGGEMANVQFAGTTASQYSVKISTQDIERIVAKAALLDDWKSMKMIVATPKESRTEKETALVELQRELQRSKRIQMLEGKDRQ